ncbi:MAG TPA: hypothetical protein DIW47_02440 [Bacteroidetes bacterium]|nr:hypothetical protein [Bacteroidota bacterium]
MKPCIVLLLFLFICSGSAATDPDNKDTIYLKVHFLYGSKPLKAYKDTEPKWFGGILGGHVGIEGDSNKILDFGPRGKFHIFAKKSKRNSYFGLRDRKSFYSILGSNPDSVKRAVVYIPVTRIQKAKFDSITKVYTSHAPYDYAFFGMRCGAASYDVLSQLGILPDYSYTQTYTRIFYPKKLRKRLFALATAKNWKVVKYEGSRRRKWEQD